MSRVAGRARAQGHRRQRALRVLLVVAGVVLLGGAADLLAAPSPAPPREPVAQPPARAGTWYCPAVGDEGETVTLTISAVGDEPSQVVVDRYGQGRAVPGDPLTVAPGEVTAVRLEGDDANAPAAVRWSGGPSVTTWRVDGERTAAAACEPAPAERWYVPGFNTMLGSQATLHLFNPYTADAVVRVTFAEVNGPAAPVLTDNILVAPGTTRSLNVRRFRPEVADLGVVVEVLTGRVVAQGELNVTPPRGTTGAAGRVMLPAASAPSESWVFSKAVDAQGSESWLSVINPGDDDAAVEVRVSAPAGDATSVLGEVSVPAGGISRIELADASAEAAFGVSLNVVNGEPVVASRLMATSVDGRQVLTGGLGASGPATSWVLLGAGTQGRAGQISLYNPGPGPAVVDVVTEGAPGQWSGMAVAPNERVELDLAAAGARPTVPVRVMSDVPIVAGVQSRSTGDAVRLWIVEGVAERDWVGRASRPAVVRDPTLSTRAVPPPPPPTEDMLLEPEATDAATPEPAVPTEGV